MNCKFRLSALILALAMVIPSAGCGKDDRVKVLDYDLTEYIKVGQYKGLEVTDYAMTATDEDVANQVLMARSNYAEAAPKTDAAVLTDQVNIDYTGYMDGKTFEGGSAKGFDLTLGSGQFIDGFEDGLVGVKPGETVTLNLSFPNPYTNAPELAGKPVQFVVKVNSIIGQKLPEYNDAFVKERYGYDNTKAFEDALRASIQEQYDSTNEYNRIAQVWQSVLDSSEVIKYPEAEYNGLYQEYMAYYTDLAEKDGKSLNEYAASTLEMAVKEFEEYLKSEVESYLKQQMIIYHIARTEGIEISEEEYNTGALSYAKRYGLATVRELESYFSPEEITQNLLYDKVLEYMAAQAVSKK